ncbi:F-box domain containing protein [Tanacetum coccineum]
MDIMNRLPVKSLLQFRIVSKQWKSCIDLINFQNTYSVRSSNDCCMILMYNQSLPTYMLALDQNLTYSPSVTTLNNSTLLPIGTCHRIWCFSYGTPSIMATLWIPSIKRSINILVLAFTSQPKTDKILIGFGVRPDTLDPTIIKNKLENDRLPRESIRFNRASQAVVGRLLFWAGHERFVNHDGVMFKKHLLVSFDLISHSFQVHDIDAIFRDGLTVPMCISSLGNSLIVSGSTDETKFYVFYGWSLLVDVTSVTSFTLLFAIPTPSYVKLLGFSNDEIPLPIVEVPSAHQLANSVQVFNQVTQSFQNLGIQGVAGSFYIGPYKESLIFLPYPDRAAKVDGLMGIKSGSNSINIIDNYDVDFFLKEVLESGDVVKSVFIKSIDKTIEVTRSSSSKPLDIDLNITLFDEHLTHQWKKNTLTCIPTTPHAPILDLKNITTSNHGVKLGKHKIFDDKKACMYEIGFKCLIEGYEYKVVRSCPNRYTVECVH